MDLEQSTAQEGVSLGSTIPHAYNALPNLVYTFDGCQVVSVDKWKLK